MGNAFDAHDLNPQVYGTAPIPCLPSLLTTRNFELAATTRKFGLILGTTFAYTFFQPWGPSW